MRLPPISHLTAATLLAITPTLPAQTAPASAPAAAQSQSAPQATLRTSTSLVLVDVVATDHDRPVVTLDRKAFHIFEDGKEVPISSFELHQPATASAPPAFMTMALPANTYTNLPAYPPSSAVNVLLLDALNTQLRDQMFVRRKMIDYLETVKPGTTLAIFGLSTQLRMITPFTTDAAGLARAMKNPKANPQETVVNNQSSADLTAQQNNAVAGQQPPQPPGAGLANRGENTAGPMDAVAALQRFENDQAAFDIDVRMKTTLSAMQQLARYFGGMDGRKNVIWFSAAFPFSISPDINFLNAESFREEIQKTDDMLAAARVAIYPVDARGLMIPSQFNAAVRTPVSDATLSRSIMQEDEEMHNNQATMQVMAAETGGKAYLDTNDLDKAVADAVDNGSSYYTIAYVPPGKHDDGKYHKIQVRVDGNPGLKLAYRRGYYGDKTGMASAPPSDPSTLFASALAHDAPAATQVLFRARVLPASDPQMQGAGAGPAGQMTLKGTPHRYVVDLTLDPHGLTFNPGADGVHQAALELAMVAYDADGNTVNFYQHSFQLGLKDAQMDQVMNSGIGLRLPFDLPAGPVNLRIGVHDLNANRAGSLEVPLQVSAP